jgi:hypothetical protein
VSIIDEVHRAARKRVLFLPHAIAQMSRADRMIDRNDVETVVWNGEVIEDYPTDPRGHSCLTLGFTDEARPIHVLCSPRPDYLSIITAYAPDPVRWHEDFRSRRR